ncbi:MAG: hypothetical protein KDK23_14660 [Leptospiraceae bacterium]|nr:hypothetical protein [Leptospiraceae bacterium]
MTDDLEKRVLMLEFRMDETWNKLNESIHSFQLEMQELHSDVRGLHTRIDELGYQLNGRIDEMGRQLNGRIDEMGHQLNGRIDEMGRQLNGRIDEMGHQLNGRMDSLQHTMVVQTRWILALGGFLAIALPITFSLADRWL